ncbi:hypothetical protein BLOT_001794 [Blomia tropicalis]|nr:hypothetical protein BLOT_001794 [Blomia tropicalis]
MLHSTGEKFAKDKLSVELVFELVPPPPPSPPPSPPLPGFSAIVIMLEYGRTRRAPVVPTLDHHGKKNHQASQLVSQSFIQEAIVELFTLAAVDCNR